MKLIRNALAMGAVAAVSVVACSNRHGADTAASAGTGAPQVVLYGRNDGDTGTVQLNLQIAAGDFLYALNYTCTGPSAIPPGTVNFYDAQSIEYILGGVQAGVGYQCTLTGTDSNGDPCSGTTTPFMVSAGQVTGASVAITCTVPTDASSAADVSTGSVGIDATANVVNQGAFACPGITAFSIVPAELIGSQPAQLTIDETGPIGLAADGGPTSSDIIWTATCASPPCGAFSPGGATSNASTSSFMCGPKTPQDVTIEAQVTDYETNLSTGVTSDVCAGKLFTTLTATIHCEGCGAISCFVLNGAQSVVCGNSPCTSACTNINGTPVDPNNCGGCGVTCSAPTPVCGHNAATNTNSCSALPPGLPCVQLVGGVPADTLGNKNCIQCDQNTSKLCDGTQAILVTRDEEKGLINGNVPAASSCYECAVNDGFLDSTVQVFVGNDCEDLSGAAVQQCLDALNCYLGSPQSGTAGTGGTFSSATAVSLAADCPNEKPAGIFNCFCGTNEPDVVNCKAAGTVASMQTGGLGVASPNGVCINQILAGTGATSSTINSTIINDMTNTTLGAGLASEFVQIAGSNLTAGAPCPVCYQ
jgi:hypothetical protein